MDTRDNNRAEPIGNEHSRIPDADRVDETTEHKEPNPPRTTTGKVTAPKFGSAGSGGAELEPGPERP
jgi:hypothetical protein